MKLRPTKATTSSRFEERAAAIASVSPIADPLRPRFPRDLTDVWVHTVNLGVDFLF